MFIRSAVCFLQRIMTNSVTMKKDKNTKCDPCEQKFEEGVREIVDQVEGYTRKERADKQKEVAAAFTAEGKEKK